MKADTLKLTGIFRKDVRYIVPMFQRPYVWNEEEHWRLLWEDLRQVVEDLLQRRQEATEDERTRQVPEQETPPLFLGAMVFDQLATQTSKLETREVIDGQQRLITLQVLLSAARAVAVNLEFSDQVSFLMKLMYNDADLVKEETHRLKVWPIEPDREAFQEAMRSNSLDSLTPSRDGDRPPIADCYRFFVEEIHDWVLEGREPPEERMDALTSSLWRLVRVVVIDLEPKDDPQVIFETLNARGTPLLAADLMKNLIFREAKKEGRETETLHERYWQQFDREEWREEVRQGRLERPRIDVFVMHWLTMRTATAVRAQQLFPAFRNYLTRSEVTVEEVLRDIAHYAKVYRRFTSPDPTGREGLFFRRLDVMETTTPFPLLLWMYGHEDVPASERLRAIQAIESWLVRRMLCRLTTKNYNRIFIELLNHVQNSTEDSIGETVVEFFRQKEGASEYWPRDDELTEAMTKLPYWSRINRRRLKMVFRALERELRDTRYSEGLDISQKLHIEHILPREWAHHWPLPGNRPEEVERIERDEAKHTVGNLTVLTEKLNPKISNWPWAKKRKEIQKHSVLLLNKQLVDSYPDRWDEETIVDRARSLAATAQKVWPGPDAKVWQ